MPVPTSEASWGWSLLWLAGVIVAAYGVSELATRIGLRRAPYVAVLTVVTAGLSAGYVAWLGVSAYDVLTTRWAWGLLAAPLSAGFAMAGMRRMPVWRRRRGRELAVALAWEGVVYGVAEGVLLSALPAFVTWQLVHELGWSGPGAAVARWTLPVAASLLVIVVHHLGYPECRNRVLLPIAAGCGLLTVGYLVTASVIAPALGHVLMHVAAITHGTEMPPYEPPAELVRPERATPVRV